MKQHIAFIAMSGVRAHNEELTRLGLTLPGFVERNKTIASLPSLGLLTLAGLTPDRFKVSYHEIADLKKLPEQPMDFDLVAISTFTAQFYEACTVADYYRAHGIPVVMGGITASALREQAGEHCTSVVVGEGELLWPELLADLERGYLKAVYRTEREFDLHDAPMPRFELLDPSKYNRITVQTSRGCPHQCEFCASSILLTRRYKVKPVDKVIEEIREIKRLWPKPFIEFADDNSFVHRSHYKELLRRLAGENVRWFTEADVRVAQDEELLGLMQDSGCKQVLIGLESWSSASLRGLELKNEWKWRQRDFYKTAIEKIQSYGITVNGCFIFGLDGDTPEVFEETLDFVRDSGLYEVQITFLTAFPGTLLYARLRSEGRILRDRAWELCTLFDINIQPKNMSVEELQTGFLKLAKVLYSAEETHERQSRFKLRLKDSPNFGQRSSTSDAIMQFAECCG
ncbi:MAG TPA: radical SAM protein [Candidatus Acidoferrales bacterium]|nr:radical SAM protein [Candidatus Acidoferrales bacterium]